MDEFYQHEALRKSLIIAGLKEIEEHGLSDFSLRRVASACGVSCAAPYRHFKSKNDLILAIINFINEQWRLLQDQICLAFKDDPRRRLTETCIALIRFWIANPHYRAVILMDSRELDKDQFREKSRITEDTRQLIYGFCKDRGFSEEESEKKVFAICATMYGATQMLSGGELENTPHNIEMIKNLIEKELE